MVEIEAAEKAIAELRETLPKLEADVDKLLEQQADVNEPEADQPPTDRATKIRAASEVITQALLKVDNIQISKDLAAEAHRNKERDKSRKVAVLLARRKTIVKKLNLLGDKVDQLLNPPSTTQADQSNDTETGQ